MKKNKLLNFVKNPFLLIPSLGFRGFFRWIPDATWLKIIFRIKTGYKLNLKEPKTFNEKLQWLKLNDRNPLYTKLVDKFAVRDYVKDTIGEEYLVPLLGVWDCFDDIDFEKLPDRFVLKCTHDSGGLVICKDKKKLDIPSIKKKICKCMKFNYYWAFREWPYKDVKPRIVAEEYLEDEKGSLNDYKIFCFNGVAKVWFLITGRSSGDTRCDYYDFDGKLLPLTQGYPNSGTKRNMPPEVFQMKKLAEKLTSGMKHCRADFYLVNGKIYFGELTFFDSSGLEKFEPVEWDYKFGNMIDLR